MKAPRADRSQRRYWLEIWIRENLDSPGFGKIWARRDLENFGLAPSAQLFQIDAAQDSEGFVEIVGWEGSNEVFIDHPFYFRIKCG